MSSEISYENVAIGFAIMKPNLPVGKIVVYNT